MKTRCRAGRDRSSAGWSWHQINPHKDSGTREGTEIEAWSCRFSRFCALQPKPLPYYFAFTNATVVSSMRLLKPHSLSYQEHTLTRLRPNLGQRRVEHGRRRVVVEVHRDQRIPVVFENTLEFGFRSLLYRVVDLFDGGRPLGHEAKIDDGHIDGRKRASQNRPACRSTPEGTSPTAAAAPVLVGIMDMVAERARRRSV